VEAVKNARARQRDNSDLPIIQSGGGSMFAMLTLILSQLRKAAGWALASLMAFLAVWGLAKRDARRETALQAAERYAKTRRKIDDADTFGNDPDAARRWLHERGKP